MCREIPLANRLPSQNQKPSLHYFENICLGIIKSEAGGSSFVIFHSSSRKTRGIRRTNNNDSGREMRRPRQHQCQHHPPSHFAQIQIFAYATCGHHPTIQPPNHPTTKPSRKQEKPKHKTATTLMNIAEGSTHVENGMPKWASLLLTPFL